MNKIRQLKIQSQAIRKKILDIAVNVGAAHIAPSYSCIEILVALYLGGGLNVKAHDPQWEGRDRFILSKGHAALALYTVLATKEFIPMADLESFTKDGSRLGAHPENSLPGVETFTGSLGHGLSIGAGIALGAKLDHQKYLSVILIGDGECHEGSIWEAAMFASAHKLNNLIVFVDYNRLSATDVLKNYLNIDPFKKKWEAFGWETILINGHCIKSLLSVFTKMRLRFSTKPLVVIASTIKGKGVSFMENNPIWHYRVPSEEKLKIAYNELKNVI